MIIAFKLLTAHILGDIRRFEGKGGDPQAGALREELLNAGIFTLASVLLLMPGSQPRLWVGIVAAAILRGLPRAFVLLSGTGPVGRFLPGPAVETLRYGEAVGFLLAAKALVRYPEIQEDRKGHFAEYFLVGTLTSVGLAILGGIILKHSASILR